MDDSQKKEFNENIWKLNMYSFGLIFMNNRMSEKYYELAKNHSNYVSHIFLDYKRYFINSC